jgi:NAD+ kinase
MTFARGSRVATDLQRVGVIVHPSRDIDGPLGALRGWAGRHDVDVVQVPVPGQDRNVAKAGVPEECDLIVSIGGDGTMLAAMRAAVAAGRPVLGVSCGSLGVLTTVPAAEVERALDRVRSDDWTPQAHPALAITRPDGSDLFALNDIGIVRNGIGQVRVTSRVDGILFSRLAGDGCIVCTPVGSSAYSLAAGGPLLTPGTQAYLFTPLPTHGGSRQSLVICAPSRLQLEVSTGIGGARLEVDGQVVALEPSAVTIGFRPSVATTVAFPEQEPLFVTLRRRQIVVDSPRIVADSARG